MYNPSEWHDGDNTDLTTEIEDNSTDCIDLTTTEEVESATAEGSSSEIGAEGDTNLNHNASLLHTSLSPTPPLLLNEIITKNTYSKDVNQVLPNVTTLFSIENSIVNVSNQVSSYPTKIVFVEAGDLAHNTISTGSSELFKLQEAKQIATKINTNYVTQNDHGGIVLNLNMPDKPSFVSRSPSLNPKNQPIFSVKTAQPINSLSNSAPGKLRDLAPRPAGKIIDLISDYKSNKRSKAFSQTPVTASSTPIGTLKTILPRRRVQPVPGLNLKNRLSTTLPASRQTVTNQPDQTMFQKNVSRPLDHSARNTLMKRATFESQSIATIEPPPLATLTRIIPSTATTLQSAARNPKTIIVREGTSTKSYSIITPQKFALEPEKNNTNHSAVTPNVLLLRANPDVVGTPNTVDANNSPLLVNKQSIVINDDSDDDVVEVTEDPCPISYPQMVERSCGNSVMASTQTSSIALFSSSPSSHLVINRRSASNSTALDQCHVDPLAVKTAVNTELTSTILRNFDQIEKKKTIHASELNNYDSLTSGPLGNNSGDATHFEQLFFTPERAESFLPENNLPPLQLNNSTFTFQPVNIGRILKTTFNIENFTIDRCYDQLVRCKDVDFSDSDFRGFAPKTSKLVCSKYLNSIITTEMRKLQRLKHNLKRFDGRKAGTRKNLVVIVKKRKRKDSTIVRKKYKERVVAKKKVVNGNDSTKCVDNLLESRAEGLFLKNTDKADAEREESCIIDKPPEVQIKRRGRPRKDPSLKKYVKPAAKNKKIIKPPAVPRKPRGRPRKNAAVVVKHKIDVVETEKFNIGTKVPKNEETAEEGCKGNETSREEDTALLNEQISNMNELFILKKVEFLSTPVMKRKVGSTCSN